jgi:hypothetical protein
MRWIGIIVLMMLYACSPTGSTEKLPTGIIKVAGQLEDSRLREASGIAVSARRDDLLWIINDGGSKSIIHATGPGGEFVGQLRLDEVDNRDWEDLATMTLNGTPFLIVADIGDNDAEHETSLLYVIEEAPIELEDDRKIREPADWVVEFRYPDGPRDAEAIAVDATEGLAYILSKRDLPPRMYSVPITADIDSAVTASLQGSLTSLPDPDRNEIDIAGITKDWFWQPTAMDFSRDRRHAVVLTYAAIYLFRREDGQSWLDAMNTEPLGLSIERIRDAEAITFSADGKALYLTVEQKRGAPLFRIDITDALEKMAP